MAEQGSWDLDWFCTNDNSITALRDWLDQLHEQMFQGCHCGSAEESGLEWLHMKAPMLQLKEGMDHAS